MTRYFRSLAFAVGTIGLLASVSAQAGLVVNPGFETSDFTGWTTNADVFTTGGVDNQDPHGGKYAAYFGSETPTTPDTLSQLITTTVNQTYTVSFWLQNENFPGGQGDTSFTAQFGSKSFSITGGTPFTYAKFSFDVAATSASTLLSFQFLNQPSFFDFDDVSVELAAPAAGGSTVPEPASFALLGLAGAAGAIQRRRRVRSV